MFHKRKYILCILAVIGLAIMAGALLVRNDQAQASAPLPPTAVMGSSDSNMPGTTGYLPNQAVKSAKAKAAQAKALPFGAATLDTTGSKESGGAQQNVLLRDVPLEGTPTPTVTGTPPTATPTRTRTSTPTASATVCNGSDNYSVTPSKGVFVPGTLDIGNHCDDCTTQIALPFAFRLYDQTFTTAFVDSNGNLGFVAADDSFTNSCLPDATANYAIFPHYDDLCTGACGASTCTGCGVFTSVTGTAPNRSFNIEWRANYYNTNTALGFEVQLYENSPTGGFDIVYGTIPDGGSSATVGVQKGTGLLFTQFECDTGGLASGLALSFALPACATFTPVPPTNTPTEPPTNTPVSTGTPTSMPNSTATVTATACTLTFSDVPVGSTFYQYIRCLACRGIINGYPDGTFKPGNNVTRGQLSKIVSNSAGFNDIQTTQMFQDVPVGSTFFQYIGRLASRGFINGYACGTPPAGACVPPGNLPYFLPNANSTRGQISKIVSNAAGFNEVPSGQQFQDVSPTSAFYAYIYRLVLHNVMSGYPCGTPPAGACVPPGNLPYFLPSNNATRGQTSKIVSNTFFPNCQTPEK
jgi:hypothetical protein